MTGVGCKRGSALGVDAVGGPPLLLCLLTELQFCSEMPSGSLQPPASGELTHHQPEGD